MAPAAGAHSEEAAISVKNYGPVQVDGKLEDWVRRLERSDWTGQLKVKKGEVVEWMRAVPAHVNHIVSLVEAGTVSGPDDFSASVYTMWDDDRWYIAAVVRDDQVVTQHDGENIWQDDCVELWIDGRHDALTHTLFQEDEYQLGFSPASQYRNAAVAWAWRNARAQQVIGAMEVASAMTPTGYIIEAAVPWKALQGLTPAIGGLIGFNLSIVDKDEDQVWTHVTWSGKTHADPTQFGHLYFLDAPVNLFPSDVFELRPESSPWDVLLDNGKERTDGSAR